MKTKSIVEKFLEKIKKDKIMSFQAEFISYFVSIDWLKYYDYKGKIHSIHPLVVVKKNNFFDYYISDDKYVESASKTLNWYIENKWSLTKNKKDYEKIKKEIDEIYENYFDKGYEQINEKEKLKLLYKIYQLLLDIVARTLYIERFDKDIYMEVLLKENLDLEKIWDISQMLTFPSFETKNNQSILKIINEKKEIDRLQYIFTTYVSMKTRKETIEEIKKLDAENLQKEINTNLKEVEEVKEEKEKLVKELTNDENKILEFLDFIIFCRDERKEYIQKTQTLLYNLTEELFNHWNIPLEILNDCLLAEVIKGKEYMLENLEGMKKRKDSFVLMITDENDFEISLDNVDETLQILRKKFKSQHESKNQQIKGQVGSKGNYIGKVKIILKKSEFENFNDGEVLVTGMTRPEFVPLMKKAGAIVTDEGGITCHAAIVSRELQKPCIIGTKIGTHTLKDGDLVEVDANTGIVRIIK
jgi:phosphohistidine swiveling domain-containing protein